MTATREFAITRTGRFDLEQISRQFADTFETLEVREDLFSTDVFFDLNMPVWRFQLQGREPFAEQLRRITRGDVRIEVLRTLQTDSGFVTDHVETQQIGQDEVSARKIWLCELVADKIVHATCYCTGEWNAALRARHALEAPMLRP